MFTMSRINRATVSCLMVCNCILLAGCSKKEDQGSKERTLSTVQEPAVNSHTAVVAPEVKKQEEVPAISLSPDDIKIEFENSDDGMVDPNSEIIKTLLKEAVAKINLREHQKQQSDQNHALDPNNVGSGQIQLAMETNAVSEMDDESSLEDPNSQSALHQEWAQCNNPAKKIELLESFWGVAEEPDAQVLSILQQALQDPDPQVGLAASETLSQCTTVQALPAIEQALVYGTEEVKINALDPLGKINDPGVVPLLSLALEDPAESVRSEALWMADEQEGVIQLDILTVGMASPYDDVKYESLSILEMRGDKESIPLIMQGLNDPSDDFFVEVNSTLSFLIDQEFESHQDAVSWWELNQDRFDEDLFEK